MTIDEVVLLLKASQANGLTKLQEMILRSLWESKTYANIALEVDDGEDNIRKISANLWQLLSNFWQEPINKCNFRSSLELRPLSTTHQQLITEFHQIATAISLEFPSSPVSLNSRFYIPRPPMEELVYAQIAEPGSVISIRASKKMGKSSLILRVLERAMSQGFSTVNLDFQQADKAVFTSLDKFLRWLCANLSRELQLEAKLNDYWDEDMGSKVSCSIYFQSYLLPVLVNPLVLVLNEVDLIFEYPEIAGEFLSLLRSWHEQAKRVEIWQKIRLILVYSGTIMVPIKLTQSPFNIGLTINLPNFTTEQVQDLAQRHGLDWTDGKDAQSLMAMVGGHPYLVRLALYHLVGKGGLEQDLKQLLEQAATVSGIYHDYLQQYLLTLRNYPELELAFYQVITSTDDVKLEPILAYKLQNLGLIKMKGDRCVPGCELYRLYFSKQLNKIDNFNDVRLEQLEKENQQLRVLSNLDELTGLANRRYFHNYLQIQWEKAISNVWRQKAGLLSTTLSMILCDIDYFRIYNQTYGNSAGDDCLQQIAKVIFNCVKHQFGNQSISYISRQFHGTELPQITHSSFEDNSVLVARYGDEEFAIVTQIDANYAVYIAENIRQQVKNLAIKCDYPNIGGLPAAVLTVSLGVASMIPELGTQPDILVNAAQQALDQAKRKGRDRVVLS